MSLDSAACLSHHTLKWDMLAGTWAPIQWEHHLFWYRDFHQKAKMVFRSSYHYTGKSASLYLDGTSPSEMEYIQKDHGIFFICLCVCLHICLFGDFMELHWSTHLSIQLLDSHLLMCEICKFHIHISNSGIYRSQQFLAMCEKLFYAFMSRNRKNFNVKIHD